MGWFSKEFGLGDTKLLVITASELDLGWFSKESGLGDTKLLVITASKLDLGWFLTPVKAVRSKGYRQVDLVVFRFMMDRGTGEGLGCPDCVSRTSVSKALGADDQHNYK